MTLTTPVIAHQTCYAYRKMANVHRTKKCGAQAHRLKLRTAMGACALNSVIGGQCPNNWPTGDLYYWPHLHFSNTPLTLPKPPILRPSPSGADIFPSLRLCPSLPRNVFTRPNRTLRTFSYMYIQLQPWTSTVFKSRSATVAAPIIRNSLPTKPELSIVPTALFSQPW